MTLLQSAAEFQRSLAVAGAGGMGHGQKLVRHFGHGADYHSGFVFKSTFDNSRRPFDGPGILHRGAAELHHDHRDKFLWLGGTGINPDVGAARALVKKLTGDIPAPSATPRSAMPLPPPRGWYCATAR